MFFRGEPNSLRGATLSETGEPFNEDDVTKLLVRCMTDFAEATRVRGHERLFVTGKQWPTVFELKVIQHTRGTSRSP
jgi:hypothetical protein